MRLKYIIVTALGLAGILFGAWNWMQYFRQSSPAPAASIQPLRPASRVEQEFLAEQAAVTPAPAAAETVEARPEAPMTLGRNPFLTPQEEQALARGEILEIDPAEHAVQPGVDHSGLPPIEVKGLIQDNVSGRYRAIIDGKFYSSGDMIGGERIVEINANSLVLEHGDRRRTIPVGRTADNSLGVRVRKAP